MSLNFKPGSRVRHRFGKHETGTVEWIRWNWRHRTVVVRVKLDTIYGGSTVNFRLGQLELMKEV